MSNSTKQRPRMIYRSDLAPVLTQYVRTYFPDRDLIVSEAQGDGWLYVTASRPTHALLHAVLWGYREAEIRRETKELMNSR